MTSGMTAAGGSETAKRLLLLQITDSVFPIGAYSHSGGLETYVQEGLVVNEQQARDYIRNYINDSLRYTDLPAIRFVYKIVLAAENGRFKQLFDLEERMSAARPAMELRLAGNKLAARFIKTAGSFIPAESFHDWQLYADGRAGNKHQYTVSYAVFCALCGITCEDCLMAYTYSQISAMAVNCVKLIPLSQTAGQNILFHLHQDMIGAVAGSQEVTEKHFLRAVPGFELRGMQHEALYSRLYMS